MKSYDHFFSRYSYKNEKPYRVLPCPKTKEILNSVLLPDIDASANHYVEIENHYYPIIYTQECPAQSVMLPSSLMHTLGLVQGDRLPIKIKTLPDKIEPAILVEIELTGIRGPETKIMLDREQIVSSIASFFSDYLLTPGQHLILPLFIHGEDYQLLLHVRGINYSASGFAPHTLSDLTQFILTNKQDSNLTFSSIDAVPKTFSLDFKNKGIGGLDQQISQIIREGFLARALPHEYAQAYDEQFDHKGILLYGPPGTGKTLIARTIANMFTQDHVKIINGPELKNKYIGQSQENLRHIFSDAINEWQLKGVQSDLHVIIFDEIDALAPRRGSHTASGVDDDMVAQLLTLLDGVDSPKNIIVIGTTNRKDLVDPAILRPGRLGLSIEINLPDEKAREEILKIHTKTLRANELLSKDIDLSAWAKKTENYSGAELTHLITTAKRYAMQKNFGAESKDQLVIKPNIHSKQELSKITQADFVQAFHETTPALGINKKLSRFKPEEFIVYDPLLKTQIETSLRLLNNGAHTLLVHGISGTGKTQFAFYLASLAAKSQATHIILHQPEDFVGKPLEETLRLIKDDFENALRCKHSVIILDDFENLLQADAEQITYNNSLRILYSAKLKEVLESDKNCCVIATAQNSTLLKKLNMLPLLNQQCVMNATALDFTHAHTWELISKCCDKLKLKFPKQGGEKINVTLHMTMRELLHVIKPFSKAGSFNDKGFCEFLRNYKAQEQTEKPTDGKTENEPEDRAFIRSFRKIF